MKPKKRSVVNYSHLSPELEEAFNEKYPRGYKDYFPDIFKVEKPDGSFFHCVTLQVPPDAEYLVKITVRQDDLVDFSEDEDDEDDDEIDTPDLPIEPDNEESEKFD